MLLAIVSHIKESQEVSENKTADSQVFQKNDNDPQCHSSEITAQCHGWQMHS